MTITVAIPSYNKETYIERCIKSVLAQVPRPDEILLIDNCSTDRTFELAKKFGSEIKCVRNTKNLGMAGNWNRCIELCNTDLLMILHADDELLPEATKKYLEFFEQNRSAGLVHAHFYNVRNYNLLSRELVNTGEKGLVPAGFDAMKFAKGYHCSTMVVKKSVYNKVGAFIESMASDLEMWTRIARSFDVGNLGLPAVNVYLDDHSTGRSALTARSISAIEVDLQNLGNHINRLYPESMQKSRRAATKSAMASALLIIFTTSIKYKKYQHAAEALLKALLKYGGFLVAIKAFVLYLKYRRKLIQLNRPK
jgi:glycosyltransferase involved in cell wall biosynthesis